MCRSIKTLRRAGEPVPDDAARAAALQFVRKISGFRRPSARNAAAFDAAVEEIAASSGRLLRSFSVRLPSTRAGPADRRTSTESSTQR